MFIFCNAPFLGGEEHAVYFYQKFLSVMNIEENDNPEVQESTRSELEKLLEQKQNETDALKRLIGNLKKIDVPTTKEESTEI